MSSNDQVDTLEHLREVAKFKEAKSVEEMLVILVDSARRSGHLDEAGTSSYGETKILVEGAIARLAELSGGSMTTGGPRYQFPEGFKIVEDSKEVHSRYEILRASGVRMHVHPTGRGLKDDRNGWIDLLGLLEKECFEEWGVNPKLRLVYTEYHYVQANKTEEIQ
ncbi:hypothetical protein SEA_BITESIZE_87 [Gordonia phage BiteSize]|uniref:Uncharacterized protein n=1 Tax=Gordonia phage BiteSize TaxID=2759394 RepID=A0A7L7SR46_9CAUD|nr:hypothetical protein SEA_BITESIZE_87 [Gordonia phage BiteSize]